MVIEKRTVVHGEATTTEIILTYPTKKQNITEGDTVLTHPDHLLFVFLNGCSVCKQQSSVCLLKSSHKWHRSLFGCETKCVCDKQNNLLFQLSVHHWTYHQEREERTEGMDPVWSHPIIRSNGLTVHQNKKCHERSIISNFQTTPKLLLLIKKN